MFFDNYHAIPATDPMLESILCDYAKLLNELHQSSSLTRRERKIYEKKEKDFTEAFYSSFSKEIASGKAYWWRLQWNQIEPQIHLNTTFGEDDFGWHFQTEWEIIGDKHQQILVLRELGNCPKYSFEKTTVHNRLSAFSEEEQDKMRKAYNKKLDRYAYDDVLFHDDSPVHSPMGNVYASRADYYLSGEYLDKRWWDDWNYSRSLYVENEQNSMVINSKSRYYQAAYAVAQFFSDGVIRSLQLYPFQWCGGVGDIPEFAQKKYSNRDPAVAFASYIVSHPSCGILQPLLFTDSLLKESQNYEEAMRLAQIMCCIGSQVKL